MSYRPDDPAHTLLASAASLAALAHAGQFRKGERVPYLVHPLRVAEILAHVGASDAVVIAGLLHDVLEDGKSDDRGRPLVGEQEILDAFGAEVLALVKGASEPDKDAAWEERKRHTVDFLGTAPVEVVLVACADKLDNVSAMVEDEERLGDSFWERFNRPRQQQRWYHRSLLEVFMIRSPESELLAKLSARYGAQVAALYG